jgi:hypothetical protein
MKPPHILTLALLSPLWASAEDTAFFESKIRPVLADKC